MPLTAAGSIPLVDAIGPTRPSGLAPATVDPGFRNASLRSWNVNMQRQLAGDMAMTVGYIGSRGRHLRISRNINQPVAGVRPFAFVRRRARFCLARRSATSRRWRAAGSRATTRCGCRSRSACRAGCSSMRRTPGRNRSIPTRSIHRVSLCRTATTSPNQYGPSDFDARHRFVRERDVCVAVHWPRPDARLADRRRSSRSQSGNPVNIVTSNAASTECQTRSVPMSPVRFAIIGVSGSVVRSVGIRGR